MTGRPVGQGPGATAGPGSRLAGLDNFRGLIMALMALDHASIFVAHVHRSELWSKPLPHYDVALPFVTRLVSHLCAPGFFLAMGIGLALFAGSRRGAGWTRPRVIGHLALRGALLVSLQFLVENPAWSLADTGTLRLSSYCGVLYGLGAALLVWSPLVFMSPVLVAACSVAAIVAPGLLLPASGQGMEVGSLLRGLLFAPGKAGPAYVLYPLIPWCGVAGLGICLGRLLRRDADRTRRLLLAAGLVALAGFAVARLAGAGDFHPLASPGWMAFLNVTKYPPSLDFLLLTLGCDAVALALFLWMGNGVAGWFGFLAVFGRTPLFFYLVHLYLYALIGLLLPQPTTLAGMYPFWLLGLAVLLPLCGLYGRFKAQQPPTSLWRML